MRRQQLTNHKMIASKIPGNPFYRFDNSTPYTWVYNSTSLFRNPDIGAIIFSFLAAEDTREVLLVSWLFFAYRNQLFFTDDDRRQFSAKFYRYAPLFSNRRIKIDPITTAHASIQFIGLDRARGMDLAFTLVTKLIASRARNNISSIDIRDALTDRIFGRLIGHSAPVNSATFSQDGRMIATASNDGMVKIWESDTRRCLRTCVHLDPVTCVAFNNSGSTITSASSSRIKTWDVKTGKCLETFKGRPRLIATIVFNPDRTKILAASLDGVVEAWDRTTGAQLDSIIIPVPHPPLRAIAINADGTRIALLSEDNYLRIYDARSNELCARNIKGNPISLAIHDEAIFIGFASGRTYQFAFSNFMHNDPVPDAAALTM